MEDASDTCLFKDFHAFDVRGFYLFRTVLYVKYEHLKATASCNFRVKLTKSSCSEVSWICSQLFTCFFLFLIKGLKVIMGHIYFSPEFQILIGKVQCLFHIRYYKGIGCDILSYKAVTSGLSHSQVKLTITIIPVIAQRHTKTVNLLLNGKNSSGVPSMHLVYESFNILSIKNIFN